MASLSFLSLPSIFNCCSSLLNLNSEIPIDCVLSLPFSVPEVMLILSKKCQLNKSLNRKILTGTCNVPDLHAPLPLPLILAPLTSAHLVLIKKLASILASSCIL